MVDFHLQGRAAWEPVLGATVRPDGVEFRVWVPAASRVDVEIETADGPVYHPLERLAEDGEWGGSVPGTGAGARYRYRLNGDASYPDPCSRFQPEGPHGPSVVVDPTTFAWTDDDWPGITRDGLVIYECHVGTATPDGTFDALIEKLPLLRETGITALELMPVAEFPGERGWGYDGVDLCAPHHTYGGPEGLRRLVDAAHAHGLGVILDVVYNHLGPDGNYLRAFSPDYFTDAYHTPWGEALNYDGRNSHRVREFVVSNAWRWIREYHLDGLRLDAVHEIYDRSAWHILADIAARARAAAYPRPIVVTAESDTNDVTLIRPTSEDGYGLDAVWADDFHHAVRVLLTGEREGYYVDFQGTAAEIARTVQGGFLFQGQALLSGTPRGTRVTDEPAAAFIYHINNHDQIGNRAFGERLNTLVSPAAYRAASALLLLAPQTPLLFMGQEFAASAPFLYFTDHTEELGRLVTEGRRREFAGFQAFTDPAVRERIPDPQAEDTFLRSKLDWAERESHADVLSLYTDLLTLRRDDPVLRVQDRDRLRASAPAERVVALHRWAESGHRLALVNFGDSVDVTLTEVLDPSAPPGEWRVRWHSNAKRYGGDGALPAVSGGSVHLPPWTAVLLARFPGRGGSG
jgi:maltooligosyltrehalose trehalohydrolase